VARRARPSGTDHERAGQMRRTVEAADKLKEKKFDAAARE
jgi:hypothetical protein